MASGGQRGLSWLGENNFVIIAGTFLLTVSLLANFGLLSCSSPSPDEKAAQEVADFNADCVGADADKRRGDEYNATILLDPKCQAYLRYTDAQVQADRAEALQAQP